MLSEESKKGLDYDSLSKHLRDRLQDDENKFRLDNLSDGRRKRVIDILVRQGNLKLPDDNSG